MPSPGGVLWQSELVFVNHHGDNDGGGRPGWIIVSPARHVTRLWELSRTEVHALFDVAAAVDVVLTETFGSTRTMVASLGWFVDDHVHVHCAPTFDSEITRGWENFVDGYIPVPATSDEAARAVAAALPAALAARCDG